MKRIQYQKNSKGYITPCPINPDVHVGDTACSMCEHCEGINEKPNYNPPMKNDYIYNAGYVECGHEAVNRKIFNI